VSVAWKI